MNSQLRLKLIHSQATPQRVPKPVPPLFLLGEGLDAIIQHTTHPPHPLLRKYVSGSNDPQLPNQPTLYQRLQRYYIAATLHPAGNALFAERRTMIGELIQQAWKEGRYPRIRRGVLLLSIARGARKAMA